MLSVVPARAISPPEKVERADQAGFPVSFHSEGLSRVSDPVATPTDPSAPSGERRQVTALFADMVGFTAISERVGEEGTFALIQPIYELMAGAVREQGGSVTDFLGDGIMALFGASDAPEDAALRACRAGLLIHERLAAAAPAIEDKHGVRPHMRIGINSGLVVVTQIRGANGPMAALGDTVNLASRLQTLAEPGTVNLSEATHRLVHGLVETTFVGTHAIKGKAEPQKVYRLNALLQGAARFEVAVGRGLSPYVGRDRELAVLRRTLGDAREELRVIDIAAEPGMGKSRLLYEFRQRIGQEQAFILTGSCSPDGRQTPFLPFIEVVRSAFQVKSREAENDVVRKLKMGLTALGLNSPESLGLLLNMFGLNPPEGSLTGLDGVLIGLRTRDLLQIMLEARCRLSPVVLLIEDLHWIDSASQEVLCVLSWNRDPATGVIFIQSGPRRIGSTLASRILGGRDWNEGRAHRGGTSTPLWARRNRIRSVALRSGSGSQAGRSAQRRAVQGLGVANGAGAGEAQA